jgi:4-amino-4-deoxy-L-arabinose transferase-like glycosyltransferase
VRPEAQLREWWTRQLAGPMIAAGLVRLALLAVALARCGSGALYRADTLSYLEPGRNLLLHGSFVAAGVPDIARTPGYALFLAVASLAGPIAAALAQVILSAISVVLVWRLARAVFADGRIALIAAWIFAFEPLSIIYSILLLSETLFLALFLMSLIRLAEFLRSGRLWVLAEAGLWLVAATFVRPVTYYLPVALAAGLMLVLAHVPRLRWKAPAVLLLSVLPWLAAWQIRNYVETGFAGFSSIQTENLYFFSAAEVTSRVEHRTLPEIQNEFGYNDELLFLERHPRAAEWNQAQKLEFMRTEARRILREHPWLFLRTHLAGSIRTALNPGGAALLDLVGDPVNDEAFTSEREQGPMRAALWIAENHPWQSAAMAALGALLLGLYGYAAMGVVRAATPSACIWMLLGVVLYFFGVSGGAVAAARLRLPVMPIVCVLAAAAFVHRRRSVVSRNSDRLR